ncbi:Pentachlorophenol 4-monooxygenase [Symmachiella macrocystis]|uniref:Pentachlorophenol 4-monooxygenase n=1 Tax=Symmachiella macrocystis TaxID=2527985 RepID=A0A5C6B7K1_9PLAN|nr:FAD-dependent monooxygenase [Symmachiella macrocystis]TWU07269.1 Pentachlorophenol 4-monooxygenase [Symmachiella macrocystis]
MMNKTSADSPVLVVGGRTTGLMMAAELARHDVAVRIIDKSPGIDPHCRATVLHSRSLEILHSLGIVDDIVACAQPLHGVSLYVNGEPRGRSEEMPVDSPFPLSLGLPQSTTESILEKHLNDLGVFVERNTQLTSLEQSADKVRARLLHYDGRAEVVETPWVIGCDGAHSTVRHQTEETFPGDADPYPYLLADVVMDGPLEPGDVYIFLHDDGELFLFILNEGRRMVVANVAKETDISRDPTCEQVQELVTQRSQHDFHLSDPRWLTHFHINYRLAPHYRHGRTFLAGDAAHVHSLLGGLGMNTGIQDAHNLAWKLALVMRGVAPATWLDTYETERRQVAEDVIATTKLATQNAELFAELSSTDREKLVPHMFVPEGEKMRVRNHEEQIDLDYRSSSICFEPEEGFANGPHPGARALDSPIHLDGQLCQFYDLLRSSKHGLFLFAPASSQGTVSTELTTAAEAAARDHGDWIAVHLVDDWNGESTVPSNVTPIEDPQQTLRQRYGIGESTGLYLIRPDGYVAYRSRQLDSLDEYLARIL